jgi:hypothetical protein
LPTLVNATHDLIELRKSENIILPGHTKDASLTDESGL